MTNPVVTLITCADFPHLDPDEAGLPDALRERGMEPRIAMWDDPSVDWSASDLNIIRSVRDYAGRRDEFLAWARSVPRLLNQPEQLEWNSDKHYLRDMQAMGLPVVDTVWLEPDSHYTKQQVHTRFPAQGDFVVKPVISSGGRGTGRYTSTDAVSRGDAVAHAHDELENGHAVMVQRYLDQIDRTGEISLIYLNGLPAYMVQKEPLLHPSFKPGDVVQEEVVRSQRATEEQWRWGEKIRQILHAYMRKRYHKDALLLYDRVDLVPAGDDDNQEFYVMEVSLVDASLYLSIDNHVDEFADAIAVRAFW
ncbi:MAG: glutathione synthetase [Actinomycetaceae bacterium]|nr:glutathione synthetase [Actinomycetaceae bacterium]MDY6083380.1 glutathione synthetase [Actinomycetaceae bacterium]